MPISLKKAEVGGQKAPVSEGEVSFIV